MITLISFIVSSPRVEFLGKKTPFLYTLEYIGEKIRLEKNVEVYRAISQLKNLIIAKKDNPPSSDFVLEQLKKFSKKTRPIFNQMIYLWSMEKKVEACRYFSSKIGTQEAEEFADLILKFDELPPIELKNQLDVYQEKIQGKRETQKSKENENRSYLVYSLVMASLAIILTNFVIVAFYIDNIKLLNFQ